MATDWRVEILGYDFTDKTEWGVSIEETLGSPATASFTLQDRQMGGFDFTDLDPAGFNLNELDVLVEIAGAAVPLFRGKLLGDDVELREGFPWRFHKISCTDYQREIFDRRLVGAPGGDDWIGPDSDGNYVPVDPLSLIGQGETDKSAVATIIDFFAPLPAAVGIVDTDTFVNEYATLDGAPYQADKAKVRSVLDHIAGYVSGNLQYWMDPALRLHWQVIPRWYEQEGASYYGPLMFPVTLFPAESAPVEIDNDNPDGVNSVGSRGLKWTFDYSNTLYQMYVSGATGFKFDGAVADLGGSGWVVGFGETTQPVRSWAQEALNVPGAVDAVTKVAASVRAMNSVIGGILRGQLTVGNEDQHPDGFHVGQSLRISDARLPTYLNGRYYTIQSVTTRLVPGHNWRIYDIGFGDAPTARASTRRPLARDDEQQEPGRVWKVSARVQNPVPGSTVPIFGQLVDDAGKPRAVFGIPVTLELHAWDAAGAPAAVGSITPEDVVTDQAGRWETALTVDTDGGYSYCVCPVDSDSCSYPAP